MTYLKIKIGRNIVEVCEDDVILDNELCVQVLTRKGSYNGFCGWASLIMSKKLFRQLKTCLYIVPDEKLDDKALKNYPSGTLHYYRFDIDRMIKSGAYETINRDVIQ